MYVIKQIPEDFVVDELSDTKTSEEGEYAIFKLWKRDCTTLKACQWIAEDSKTSLKNIGFAGSKDRQAITTQLISVKHGKKSLEKINNSIIKLEFIGFRDEPISMGDLKGNKFRITVRNIDRPSKTISQMINYFDDQRFSKSNHLIGKAIVKKNLKEACELLKEEKAVTEHLKDAPQDLVGAIKKVPFKTRMMYIHAYQSWLFNRAVSLFLEDIPHNSAEYSLGNLNFPKDDIENIRIPLIGFDINECENEKINNIYKKILDEESLKPRDFVLRHMPELTAEGFMRDMVSEVKDLKISDQKDNKVTIEFGLNKGCYATIVIKHMFS